MNNNYNSDINSTRNVNQNGLNMNQNPYINQNVQNSPNIQIYKIKITLY